MTTQKHDWRKYDWGNTRRCRKCEAVQHNDVIALDQRGKPVMGWVPSVGGCIPQGSMINRRKVRT